MPSMGQSHFHLKPFPWASLCLGHAPPFSLDQPHWALRCAQEKYVLDFAITCPSKSHSLLKAFLASLTFPPGALNPQRGGTGVSGGERAAAVASVTSLCICETCQGMPQDTGSICQAFSPPPFAKRWISPHCYQWSQAAWQSWGPEAAFVIARNSSAWFPLR